MTWQDELLRIAPHDRESLARPLSEKSGKLLATSLEGLLNLGQRRASSEL